jgi:glycosyltransferase involved in cell wall biosynthesis
VLNQTFTDWELLIVDDCSTDNTAKLIEEFTKKDSRIKFYQTAQNSGGPALPKNIGIEHSQGKYVAFLDHDDEWLPEKLEKQLALFESSTEEKLGLVSCFLNIKDNNGKLLHKHKRNYKGTVTKNLASSNFILTSSCVMTKLDILKKIGLFDLGLKTADDIDMWLRISEAGYLFDFVPEYLVNYIEHGENAYLGNKNHSNATDFLLFYEKHEKTLSKYNLKSVGNYYFYQKKYKLSRKYYLASIFSKESDAEQIIKSFAYLILSFLPSLEKFFRNIFSTIKKIIGE